MFRGFKTFDLPGRSHPNENVTIHGRIGGTGPPLLLLHGYPQTHVMWHRIAEQLAADFTVIAADLRGYGASSAPKSAPDHEPYSKRAMAADMGNVMNTLGFDSFFVGSHDRGARVAHRMALDFPDCVDRLAVLDIAPTREMYRDTSDAFARAYWHWFYLIQQHPFPEWMIEADPTRYWLKKCTMGSAGAAPFSQEAQQAYIDAFKKPAIIHATCEDYRAAATIDIAHDDADNGSKVTCPLLCLWGAHGVIEACFEPLALWRERATDVRGRSLPGGHYLAEELPEAVLTEFQDFFG